MLKKLWKMVPPTLILLFLSSSLLAAVWLSLIRPKGVSLGDFGPHGDSTRGSLPPNATLVINATLHEVPEYAWVLQIVPRMWSEGEALDIARIFNASGEIYQFAPQVQEEGWTIGPLMVFAKGFIMYDRSGDNWYAQSSLPSQETSIAIAGELIEKLRGEGFIPTSLGLSFRSVGSSEMLSISYPNGTMQEFVGGVSVKFECSYEGIPVFHESLSVVVGRDGEIIGFEGYLQDAEPLDQVSLGSPRWAIEMLEKGYGAGTSRTTVPSDHNVTEVVVNSIKLVYVPKAWFTAVPHDEQILVPAYSIKGVYLTEDGRSLEWGDGILAALEYY